MKRYRKPKIKDGELRAQWGRVDGNDPDLCYYWGSEISKRDSHLLHNTLCDKKCSTNWDVPLGSPRILWTKYGNSFIKELEERGYDLTTLRFYVRTKEEYAKEGSLGN
jgi:hypothetical protein